VKRVEHVTRTRALGLVRTSRVAHRSRVPAKNSRPKSNEREKRFSVERRTWSAGGTVARELCGRDESTVPNSVLKSEIVSIVIVSVYPRILSSAMIYDPYILLL